MENKTIKVTCSHEKEKWYMYFNNYEVSGCGLAVDLTLDDIIPGRDKDPYGDEFLCFYFKCPNCGMVSILDKDLLTIEEKTCLMKKYALVADEVLKLWRYEKTIKECEKLYNKRNEILRNINVIMSEERDTSKLYNGWEKTDKILKLEK